MRREKDIFVLAAFLLPAAGCVGQRLPPRHPGLQGLARDWSHALRSGDPLLLSRLFWDVSLSRPPGIRFSPRGKIGGKLLVLRWDSDPEQALGPGLLGSLDAYERVLRARVELLGRGRVAGRRAWARFRIVVAGSLPGGMRRQDVVEVHAELWRRLWNGPWLVRQLWVERGWSWVGLARAFSHGRPLRGFRCPATVALADLDADGRLEAAVRLARRTCWLAFESGRLVPRGCVSSPRCRHCVLVAGDCDHDERPDLDLGGDGCLELESGRLSPVTEPRRGRIRAAASRGVPVDLDGDGVPEVVRVVGGAHLEVLWSSWNATRLRTGAREPIPVDLGWVAGLEDAACSVAAGDLDGDGAEDLVVATPQGLVAYRNVLWHGGVVRLRLWGGEANPFGLGAEVRVRAGRRELRVRHQVRPGRPVRVVNIGIGGAPRVRVWVRGPAGAGAGPVVLEPGPEVHRISLEQRATARAAGAHRRGRLWHPGPASLSRSEWADVGERRGGERWTVVFVCRKGAAYRGFLALMAKWALADPSRRRAAVACLTPPPRTVPGLERWPLRSPPTGPLPRVLVYGPAGRLRRVLVGVPPASELERIPTSGSP